MRLGQFGVLVHAVYMATLSVFGTVFSDLLLLYVAVLLGLLAASLTVIWGSGALGSVVTGELPVEGS